MPEIYHPDIIREVIVIAPVATIPEYDISKDDRRERVYDNADSETHVNSFKFDGFSDFNLDLSCLSPPPSPPASTSCSSRSAHSPPGSLRSSRSVSLVPTISPLSQSKAKAELPSPRQSPVTATSVVQGSWPLTRYVGRGTPIDRSRRIEWGGRGDEVAEDGMLISAVRSSSLDASRPSRPSISQDWNLITSTSSPDASSRLQNHRRSRSSTFSQHTIRPAPIQIGGLGSDPAEWASHTHSVLGSVSSSLAINLPTEDVEQGTDDHTPDDHTPDDIPNPAEETEEQDPILDMDIGLDGTLDLGLGLGPGMNWLELRPLSGSGRASLSVYSTPPSTPQLSQSPCEDGFDAASTTVKVDANPIVELTSRSQPWWQKALKRLRRMRQLFRS